MTPRVFSRAEWLGSARWLGTGSKMTPAAVTDLVIHYPGHNNVPESQTAVPARLRSEQAYYLGKSSPYDLGYNWVIDPWGGIWTVRGWELRNAANGSTKPSNWNAVSVSVQLQVTVTGKPTAAQLDAFVQLYNESIGVFGRRLNVYGHGEGRKRGFTDATVTSCPGPHLVPMCIDAVMSAGTQPAPPAPTPPPPAPSPPPAASDAVLLYRVAAGDTYWGIARAVHADGKPTTARSDAIQAANGNRPLRPGDVIVIPGRVA